MISPDAPIQNIIVADDDEDDCVLFRDVVSELSIALMLTFAKNGDELLDILKNEDLPLPDLIFLDMNMPLKNGIECLREIKEDPRLRQIPVIVCSTSAQQRAVDMTYELKANLYIRKPDSFSKFKDVIAEVLSTDWAKQSGFGKDRFLIAT